jgi:hypothetical protein
MENVVNVVNVVNVGNVVNNFVQIKAQYLI